MDDNVLFVSTDDDRERVAQEMARYDLLAIPVVNGEQRMVGIVTHDDIIDVVVSEATEDLQRQGGMQPIEENYLDAGFLKVWRQRAVWLVLLFLAQMFTFNVLAHFDKAMRSVIVLSLFVPLLISCGGNSGSQAAALISRGLALKQISTQKWFSVLRHEFLMGLALGATLGVMALFRTYLMTPTNLLTNENNPSTDLWELTYVVACAVAAICLWGTFIGAALPLCFQRVGIDPSVASGPFVATFVDVTGIAIYFTIAQSILSNL